MEFPIECLHNHKSNNGVGLPTWEWELECPFVCGALVGMPVCGVESNAGQFSTSHSHALDSPTVHLQRLLLSCKLEKTLALFTREPDRYRSVWNMIFWLGLSTINVLWWKPKISHIWLFLLRWKTLLGVL